MTAVPPPAPEPRLLTATTTTAAFVAFALIGAVAAVYGPLLPTLQERYAVGAAAAGGVLSAHFAGSILGVLTTVLVTGRVRHGVVLMTALATMALGCAGLATAPSWPLLLASAVVVGVGFGSVDVGLNQIVAHGYGDRSAAVLNVLNAQFGVGSVVGPLLVAVVPATRVGGLFGSFALVAGVLALVLRRVPGGGPSDPQAAPPTAAAAQGGSGRRLLGLFVLGYVLYVGVETGVGGWAPTHLASTGLSADAAATVTSGFWLAMTVGRLLAAPLALRFRARSIVVAGSGTAVLALLLAAVPALSSLAYVVTGLALAPVFPTGLAWLAQVRPGSERSVGFVIAAASLGGVVFPPALGATVDGLGAAVVPLMLALIAAGSLAAFVAAAVTGSVREGAGWA